uniref:WD_REPEATS_REGION domain-containing protein n=1 Tax=Toxocara canis TaxID=6265 RepID=A0A183VFY7_TOXCA
LVFSGHTLAIECIGLCSADVVVTSCLQGKVFIWDAKKAQEEERFGSLRHRTVPVAVVPSTQSSANGAIAFFREAKMKRDEHSCDLPQIWCMAVMQNSIILGCADGSVEIANSELGRVVGIFEGSHSKAGVIHLQIRCGRAVIVRLDGTIEFLDIRLSVDQPQLVHHMRSVWYGRAHQMPITHLEAGPVSVVTASHDHTLKVFDVRTSGLQFTLQGHNASVVSACIDHGTNVSPMFIVYCDVPQCRA